MAVAGEQVRSRGWLTRDRALLLVLITATALAFLLCYLITQPFIPVLAWALALAIVGRPLHDFIAARVGNREVAAGLAVVVVAILLLVPSVFVLLRLASEATAAAELVQAENENGDWLSTLEQMPAIGPAVHWLHENANLQGAVQQALTWLTESLSRALAGSIWVVVQFLLVLFTLFFFFRDRGNAVRTLRGLMPLSDSETDEVFQRVADTIHATIYGSLFVALLQGTMGGLMFALLGLPSPVIWGLVMALLAVVPNLGTFVVWGPAAVFLALSGETWRALALVAWGGIAIAMIDNLLYPYLVGHRMRLHTLLVFFAILGGLMLLGASGVVLGPVILVITLALIDVWRRRTVAGRPAEARSRLSPAKQRSA
jgi:predicted PurR-regulated permease PerM